MALKAKIYHRQNIDNDFFLWCFGNRIRSKPRVKKKAPTYDEDFCKSYFFPWGVILLSLHVCVVWIVTEDFLKGNFDPTETRLSYGSDNVLVAIFAPEVRELRLNQGFSKKMCPNKFIRTHFC